MTKKIVTIRPLNITDMPMLVDLDHGYNTDYVWQMDVESPEREMRIAFREIRLPRSMYVNYPRNNDHLADDWQKQGLVLVAEDEDETPVGYMCLNLAAQQAQTTISDIVVNRIFRQKGIGAQLVRAAQQWARQQGCSQVMMEMQSKNHPAISLALSQGFDFCGYNDRYFPNGDIALFFMKKLT
jgi:GNAT superfamily N-acetyltransferase